MKLSLSPEVQGFLQDVLLTVLILSSVALVAARIASGLVEAYTAREEDLPSSSLFSTLTWAIVMILGVLVVLQSLGIAISPTLPGGSSTLPANESARSTAGPVLRGG